MKRNLTAVATVLALLFCSTLASAADQIEQVLIKLNNGASVMGSREIKSYPVLFEAYLNLNKPPFEIGEDFNFKTIHPGMDGWPEVSGWSESNPEMTTAILESESKTLFGLPYGPENVKKEFRDAGLFAEIGVEGSLRHNRFSYQDAAATIVAYATAESYRLMEAGKIQEGLDLAVAAIFVARQCCDRDFLVEEMFATSLVSEMLANLRDMFYVYREEITPEQYGDVAIKKLPYLRPDRARLLMPEGDRVVSEALLDEVFDSRGQADREQFASTFAQIQSKDAPLTRFGAAKRWRMIAEIHESHPASIERLQLVYDDWYRRWRIEEYDPILAIETQFERTNAIRYAAVIYSMHDIDELFDVRDELMASVYGTAMAAGVAGYKARYGKYPRDTDMAYATFVRKRSDRDPFDVDFLPFKYYLATKRTAVDTFNGRMWVEVDEGILYSKAWDREDDRAASHTSDGANGDLVLWPPSKARLREQGVLD